MRYFECLSASWFPNRTRFLAVVGVALLLCSPSVLSADNEDSSQEGSAASPSQAQGTGSAAPQPDGEPDKKWSQGTCIVDLKPGDPRLFKPSVPTTGKLHRWLDI